MGGARENKIPNDRLLEDVLASLKAQRVTCSGEFQREPRHGFQRLEGGRCSAAATTVPTAITRGSLGVGGVQTLRFRVGIVSGKTIHTGIINSGVTAKMALRRFVFAGLENESRSKSLHLHKIFCVKHRADSLLPRAASWKVGGAVGSGQTSPQQCYSAPRAPRQASIIMATVKRKKRSGGRPTSNYSL